jgi:alkyl hydroperoxide reductase subunit AhpC
MQFYPITVGQNYYEILRAIDALQVSKANTLDCMHAVIVRVVIT